MTTTTESLRLKIERAVEQVVREHLAECEAVAAAAVREAFARVERRTSPRALPQGRRRRSPERRRSREEIEGLEERLYEAICAHAGETMVVIAAAVGETPRALNRPAILLRRNGRVRSVGHRQNTRYFPTGR